METLNRSLFFKCIEDSTAVKKQMEQLRANLIRRWYRVPYYFMSNFPSYSDIRSAI